MRTAPLFEEAPPPVRRVRERAREAVAVMAFSAATSVAFALGLLVVTRLGH
jgi:hypothetical protein